MLRAATVIVSAVAAVFVARAPPADMPNILAWHQVGAAGLGMSKSSVNRVYGSKRTSSDPFTSTYMVPGGYLDVSFARDVVDTVTVSSPRYRTSDGIGVGFRIPARHRWRGFVYHVYANGTPPEWLGSFCYRGIHELVRLGVSHGVIDNVGMWYEAGFCDHQRPEKPLTPQDRAAITAAVGGHVRPIVTVVHDFRVSLHDRRWASVWITGRGRNASAGSAFVVLRREGTKWRVVDLGTSDVGCTTVPIAPLTQIGGSCGFGRGP